MSTIATDFVLNDPRMYVLAWLSQKQMEVNERGELIDSLQRTTDQIFDSMWLDYKQQCRAFNAEESRKPNNERRFVRSYPETDLKKALNELIAREKQTFKVKKFESLMCIKEDISEVNKFVRVLLGSPETKTVAVFSHWIWMIKRKMANKDVKFHIMPILFGKQGGGKTVAITKLIEEINNYVLSIKMSQLVDERYYFSLSDNYCVFFDEMQGSSRTDVDSLKNQITTNYNDVRKLGHNQVYKVKQNCSFIGATNRPINEQILDTTGMRRFFEVKVSDKLDWELLKQINFTKLWMGIDENKEEGYISEHLSEIHEDQKTLVQKDELDLFMEDFNIDLTKKEASISSTDFYDVYKVWSAKNGFKPMNNIWFGKRIVNKGAKRKVMLFNDKTQNVYIINQDSSVFSKAELPVAMELFNGHRKVF